MDAARRATSRENAEALNKTEIKVEWHFKPRTKKKTPRMMKKCTFRSLPKKNRKKIHLSSSTTNKLWDEMNEEKTLAEAQTPPDHACMNEQQNLQPPVAQAKLART
jgi:hypothetical protein